jgi:hypothetical protein
MGTSEKSRNKHRQFEAPKDFLGIEEVIEDLEGSDEATGLEEIEEIDLSPKINIVGGGKVGAGGIEDVDPTSEEDCDVIDGGDVDWKGSQESEKAKARPYIAGAVLVLWAIWTVTGLTALILTGNPTILLIGSPTNAGAGFALYKFASIIIKYYFS